MMRSMHEPLLDMTHVKFSDLLKDKDPNSAIARSIRRLVKTLDDPNGVISAFLSYVVE